uniref:Mitochondrial import inner membrane translocase subunit TIM14 n=1 Tax=Haplochromis burtoni TaxID=8153 RepID=A0A3Q2UZW7_HAPBU
MASSMVAVGLALAAAGFAGRYAMQAMKQMEPQMKQALQSFPKTAFGGGYYRGGFEPKMTKREAALVLGVRWISLLSSKDKRSKGSDGRAGQEIKVEMLIHALTDLKVFLTDCSKNKITLYKCRPESCHYYCSVYIDFVKFYKEVSI